MIFSLKPVIVYCLGIITIVVACSPQAAGPTETPAPTLTPYVFPTFAFSPPTEAPRVATAAAETSSVQENNTGSDLALDPTAVERGKDRWEALACGSCHGKDGQGSEDGSALVGISLSEETFVDFLRTGGTVGNEHQFATDRLSQRGIANLYQYVLSLEAGQ